MGVSNMVEANNAPAPRASGARWPGLLILIAALIEFLGGLSSLPILAGDLDEIPGPGLDGKIIVATIILHPIAAAAALYFVIRGKLPEALVSMAVVILVAWIAYLPSVRLHGFEMQGDGAGGMFTFLVLILPPILVMAITAMALTGTRLKLATLLAILPTLIGILAVVAFGIGVAIYGF
jgi:hypothetical protein